MNRQIDKLINSKNAVFGLFVVISISMIFNIAKVIQRNYELQQAVDRLKNEVALVEVENQNLRYNIEYYKTDSYLEVEAKRRLNLAGQNENVILLPKNGDQSIQQNIDGNESTEEKSNFEKWMIFLFGRAQ